MKAFFNRTFDNGGFLAERDHGEVRFKTTQGEERLARMMFLTGKKVDDPAAQRTISKREQKKEKEFFDSLKRKKTPPPAPKFSARARLVEMALQPGQNEFFARSIVNQLWARFLGYGLVMPLDQMHSENPPSHPELLDWLARDLVEHSYDLKRLVRGLVLSQAYSRGSRYEGETPQPYQFAVAQVRPLTPTQMANSLRLAAADPAKRPPRRMNERSRSSRWKTGPVVLPASWTTPETTSRSASPRRCCSATATGCRASSSTMGVTV